ncbi:MAG: hypothetical protein Q7R32_01970 [Dehalococcoidia bacterium]|nr:hypothetical protein [Dehalococcoidia bacterium]
MSEAEDPIRAIRVKYAQEAVPFRERVFGEAVEMLRDDLRDIGRTGSEATYRANAVGLGLLDARLYSAAADLYKWLVGNVETSMRTWPEVAVANRALLYRNWGVALTLEGDYDRGIPRFLISQRLAEATGSSYDRYAADVHLEDRFEAPAIWLLSSLADHVYRRAYGSSIDEADVKRAFERLGHGKYGIYAAVMAGEDLWRSHREWSTTYNSLALLVELRTLVTGLESLARQLSPTATDMGKAFRKLFGRKPQPSWWSAVTGQWNKTSYRDPQDFEDKLRQLLGLELDRDESFFGKSFTVALLVRNFVSHELLPSPNLITDELFPPAKCHVVAAFVALHLAVEEGTAKQGVTK